jgi:uncharacterized metal-binding protein YceD (DUF177 family)
MPAPRHPATPPEFHRPHAVADLRDGETRSVVLDATATERSALAKRFGLIDLARLHADAELTRDGRAILVRGTIAASVVQTCVVTLEPVPADIEETIDLVFSSDAAPPAAGETFIDLEAEDPPEALVAETVDLGEVVAEHLGLALDPYPRAPGAVFSPQGAEIALEDGPASGPFAALHRLKR